MFEILAMIALSLGAASGLRAMIQPDWIAGVLKLQAAPDRPSGYAEFRATFGGLFFFLHLNALILVAVTNPIISAIICMVIASGWLGAAVGRLFSILLDRKKNGEGGINRFWVGLEVIIGAVLLLPALEFRF